ncbi:phage tail sheath C-terminal domain-containing protein [Haliscomenobacter hydrossis]|uniref:Phage tail sheath protein FI n=1 Tax=Haliscomenobacter hydrossis (strain ATCC 27775 / DSM 1100 / LMG 10767 / O) TaxID=760192 RepID=F4L0H6_HALH1|nr:phage tail sheath C-terminal domain-containing protein [Haliscomenobacter hydrossis]AEE48488.1 putative phage tail sheath protein FI [Haliscomenobacter hydrossis DSM 1100]
MAADYKTPGVYVEEISKFPPSIAQVETAIPAFIGYTEKAQKIKVGDLLNKPTKIGSIAEYVELFGSGAKPKVINVTLDDSNNFKSATLSNQFYLFDSLRLFYANGGGDCYIVSVATYDTAGFTASEFTDDGKGIKSLETVDEPTILVFPDNSLLSTGNHYYDVYQAALLQCGKLMDRVGVFDVKRTDPLGVDFRQGIGVNNLSYGMAYSPWLVVNMPKTIGYRDFQNVLFKETVSTTLSGLTTEAAIQAQITALEQVMVDGDLVKAATNTLKAAKPSIRERFNELEATYKGAKTTANVQNLVSFLFDVARQLDTLISAGAGALTNLGFKTDIATQVTSTWKPIFGTLISHDKELAAKINAYSTRFDKPVVPTAAEWGGIFVVATSPAESVIIQASAISVADKLDQMFPSLRTVFEDINATWTGSVVNAVAKLESDRHAGLLQSSSIYKTIITGIQNTDTNIPPSGAVAGIYAFVDRTRGVWKAPANVSLSNVIRPNDSFTASQLDALNVDVNAGKSINAIRSFTGKGTLVFGARTLAGNDNEWRYVSVRRFFNMVEESTKKASEQFVFEPNDANTWVKIQAMIENFLNTLWRVGALQGGKPEQAFYVAVGLGKTMTPLDILEGRMIIEIGMAVVRPAEFIILRFSHKMAES